MYKRDSNGNSVVAVRARRYGRAISIDACVFHFSVVEFDKNIAETGEAVPLNGKSGAFSG